ncbi:MAG: hypothetical protein KDE15_01530 [Erythrobacter sp.]|nr:hypothetical protein [Erythrobacter sp.]
MIDYFAIALTHGLILIACWRLLSRDELDVEGAASPPQAKPWLPEGVGLNDGEGERDA